MSHFRGFAFSLVCATPSLPPPLSVLKPTGDRPKATPSSSSCWKCKFRGAIIVVVISGKEGGGDIQFRPAAVSPRSKRWLFLSLEPRCPNVRDIPLFLCMGRYIESISSSPLCTHRPPPRARSLLAFVRELQMMMYERPFVLPQTTGRREGGKGEHTLQKHRELEE